MKSIMWYDPPLFEKERIMFTTNELNIPGLSLFGFYSSQAACDPLKRHYHKDCYEVTYIKEGTVVYETDEKQFRLTRGSLLIMPPNIDHSTGETPFGLNTQYWFRLEMNRPDNFLFLSDERADHILKGIRRKELDLVNLNISSANRILDDVFKLFGSPSQENRNVGATLLSYFLLMVVDDNLNDKEKNSMKNQIMSEICEHINNHPDEVYKLEDLADNANMSLSSFITAFHSYTGFPPREYLNINKIKAAKRMLMHQSITQVAMDLNFSSSNYFATVFKKVTGITPTEYLNRNK
ncbi:MAG: AraC family transcriptional regulator [Candidatus Cloacimonetes bacterium]|nr:AraC family transcriptional regulator [Candidatus Cloacimonadota bacterium]